MGPSAKEANPSYELPHPLSPDQDTTSGLFVQQRRSPPSSATGTRSPDPAISPLPPDLLSEKDTFRSAKTAAFMVPGGLCYTPAESELILVI